MCFWLRRGKKINDPLIWMGFNCLKARATLGKQFIFYHYVSTNSWYSLYRPQKDKRLSWSWSYPVVLNTGPLGWESSTLIRRLADAQCWTVTLSNWKKQPLEVFYKNTALKNFAIFTGKHLWEIFKNTFFEKDPFTAASELTLQSDCLELCFWIAFKTILTQ